MAPPPKRRKVEAVEELVFNPDARADYLTGFHKRKVQRTKHAQELAQKREREEKIKDRKEIRDQRKRDLDRHVADVNAMLKKQMDSSDDDEDDTAAAGETDGDWAGFEDEPALVVDATDEYIDEGKFTTVTVKELDDIRDFASEDEDADEGEGQPDTQDSNGAAAPEGKQKKKTWGKSKSAGADKARKKKRNFRYESKLERQTERKKQKMKRVAAAKARRSE